MAKKIAVIIPAAGFGKRMGHEIAKQFIEVGGKTILAHTVDKIQAWAEEFGHLTVILVPLSQGMSLPQNINCANVYPCQGGKERADSVANALARLEEMGDFDWVMVHDAARPLVTIEDIEKLYQNLKDDSVGGILAEKVTATVKRADEDLVTATIPRDDLWLAQTPQMFRLGLLKQSLSGRRTALTDEASGIEALGKSPKIIEGSRNNIKITTPEDLLYFTQRITNND